MEKTCPSCGKLNAAWNGDCIHCGAILYENRTNSVTAAQIAAMQYHDEQDESVLTNIEVHEMCDTSEQSPPSLAPYLLFLWTLGFIPIVRIPFVIFLPVVAMVLTTIYMIRRDLQKNDILRPYYILLITSCFFIFGQVLFRMTLFRIEENYFVMMYIVVNLIFFLHLIVVQKRFRHVNKNMSNLNDAMPEAIILFCFSYNFIMYNLLYINSL